MNYKFIKYTQSLKFFVLLLALGVYQGSLAQLNIDAPSPLDQELESNEKESRDLNKVLGLEYLQGFFSKLNTLEKKGTGTVNIVHIGDSHIQADLLTGRLRTLLQSRFGNAGLGFTFPYKLAKTNGNHFVGYTSNVSWNAYRNIFPNNGSSVGLSGIALTTNQKDFVLELEVKESKYAFSKIKVFNPGDSPVFDVAFSEHKILIPSNVPKTVSHKIKHGESLSTIARKYGVSVNQLKRANNLTTNLIRIDKVLKIPTSESVVKPVYKSEFSPVKLTQKLGYYEYVSSQRLDRIYLLPHASSAAYSLNGLSIENGSPGILYHSIGVNGARFSDYNKYALFFNQLQGLEPDLIILSMGTNEAFDKMQTADFQNQVDVFINNVRRIMPNVELLVTTPTPSFLPKKQRNFYAEAFSDSMIEKASFSSYGLWDAFRVMGGHEGVQSNFSQGLLSKDYVHYSKTGYEYTANLFFGALMDSYSTYKSNNFKPKDEL